VKNGFLYSLNKEWQAKVARAFSNSTNLLDLEEGETVRMDLTSLVHLDHQWKNIMIPLHQQYPDYPVFIYNPYDIWKHLSQSRWDSEQRYFDTYNTNKTRLFFSLGGNSIHEIETRKLRSSNFIQVSLGKKYFKSTHYPVVFGDYIITTQLSLSTTQKISQVFEHAQSSKDLSTMIPSIGIEKRKVKLIIERNKERAKSLRKKLSADFHVPRELVEKFDLF
jgi:hypothetical protein